MIWSALQKFFGRAARKPVRINNRLGRLLVEQLEDRVVPAANPFAVDVTGIGGVAFSNDGNVRMTHVDIDPTGSGVIDPFLRIHHQDFEQGYNTSFRQQGQDSELLDDITNLGFTHDIKLSDVKSVTIDNVLYRQFRLDLGEPGNDTSESGLIDFGKLMFFTSPNSHEHLTGNTWGGAIGGATLRYDMDATAGFETDFTLRDLTSGNGALDYFMEVKDSVFAGAGADDYLYMYTSFGSPPPTADGTFEEWSYESGSTPPPPGSTAVALSGRKFEDLNGNGNDDGGTDPGIGAWHVTVWLDSNGNGIHEAVETHDIVTNPNGAYFYGESVLNTDLADDGAGDGFAGIKYEVQEVTQPGWTQTFGNAGYSGTFVAGHTGASGLDFGNFHNIDICVTKFYDADGDGARDADEPGINGWNFGLDTDGDTIPDRFGTTAGDTAETGGTYCFTNLGPGTYTVYELDGLSGAWFATTATSVTHTAASGTDFKAEFGNLKLDNCGGLTIGFWGNKNGLALLKPADFTGLTALNLRNADGSPRDFTGTLACNKKDLDNWLKNATATNMQYMLSAQLAATWLNTHADINTSLAGVQTAVDPGCTIYLPALFGWSNNAQGGNLKTNLYSSGTWTNSGSDFVPLSEVMSNANTLLGSNGTILAGNALRPYAEALKIVLDGLNNSNSNNPSSPGAICSIGLDSWHDDDNNGVIDDGEI